jgi:magnesium transporter
MDVTVLQIDAAGNVRDVERLEPQPGAWHWINLRLDPGDGEEPPAILDAYALDSLAVHDAFNELDLPKFEDFGDHLVLILHDLRQGGRLTTHELNMFVTATDLITIHVGDSRAVETMQEGVRAHPELAAGGCAELAARLADGVNRRLLAVVDAFDERADELVGQALAADRHLLNDVAAVRADLAAVRRVVLPQREALDLIRSSESALLSDAARRRFSDVFDVAVRAAYGLDAARSVLSEAVDAYRGAEARSATQVTKVLTIYAAILLPLSLIVGYFGMNHENLPTLDRRWGWIAVTISMVAVIAVSLGVFVSQGWIRRPSGRAAGAALGRGLAEAARTPAQVASAVFAITTLPVKSARTRLDRSIEERDRPG